MRHKSTYRPDIDGLRAVAVLAVVFFHVDPNLVPGGFVGVDIFFVISGFLITGIITRQVQSGSFSFTEFYRRRIRRILPVLTCVILATLAVGQFLLTPDDLERLSLSAITSQLFVGNVYFTYFLDTSYFADDAGLEPLLHLWSLGVEEQFYLLWPATLVGLLTWRRRRIAALLVVVVGIASFALPVLVRSIDRMFLYYMLPSRAGELLTGALCFYVTMHRKPPARIVALLAGWIGLALIVLSLALIDSDNLFPGLTAVPVSIGSGLIIYAGTQRNMVSRILSIRLVVGIGLISYSMYLWHWPVLAYVRYVMAEVGPVAEGFAVAVIFGLSYLSYRFVEQPFRKTDQPFRRVFLGHFLAPTLIVCMLCGGLLVTRGYGVYAASSNYIAELSRIDGSRQSAPRDKRVCQEALLSDDLLSNPRCVINGSDEPRILLWGDSNASHYVGVFAVLAEAYGFSFRNFAHAACPPVLDEPERFASETWREACVASSRMVHPRLDRYGTLVIGAAWNTYFHRGKEHFEETLAETLRQFVASGKQVIVLGVIPEIRNFDRECDRKALKIPGMDCDDHPVADENDSRELNDRLRPIVETAGAVYLDFNDWLCHDGLCSSHVDGEAIYYNRSHLSMSGSTRLGQMMVGSETANRIAGLLGK